MAKRHPASAAAADGRPRLLRRLTDNDAHNPVAHVAGEHELIGLLHGDCELEQAPDLWKTMIRTYAWTNTVVVNSHESLRLGR